jgi:membrane protease YdiL (CAAX protease family)
MESMVTHRPLTRLQAWIDISLLVSLVLLSSLLAADLVRALLHGMRLPVVLVLQGALILLVLRGLLWYRGESWGDLGLRELRPVDLGRAVGALLLCFVVNIAFTSLLFVFAGTDLAEHFVTLKRVALELQKGVPYEGLVAMMLFVGIYEEIAARGFLLARSRCALSGAWAPVLLSSALFGLGHVYQGWVGVAQTFLIGVILARLTLHWGTLWPAILAHAGLNTLSLTLIRALPGLKS